MFHVAQPGARGYCKKSCASRVNPITPERRRTARLNILLHGRITNGLPRQFFLEAKSEGRTRAAVAALTQLGFKVEQFVSVAGRVYQFRIESLKLLLDCHGRRSEKRAREYPAAEALGYRVVEIRLGAEDEIPAEAVVAAALEGKRPD
jgi:hypothetical protein